MNNNYSGQIETVINVKEIIWDLLEQWKAVLITALLMMVLIAGAKYAKDINDYNTAQSEREAEAQTTATVDERIEDVLKALPDEERSTVLTMVKQNEWIESEKEYINNSILMNTDLTNQRTLVADYYISTDEDSESVRSSLTYGYSAHLKEEGAVNNIGKAIDPEADSKYIAELISVDNTGTNKDVESTDAVMEVKIVLPDNADAEEVETALTAELQGYSSELGSKVSPHRLSLLSAGEAYLYNGDAVNNRNNILYSIYNLQNNTKNMQTSLSDGQKSAIEAITAIKTTEKTASDIKTGKDNATETEDSKPGISKKYAVLGFVLGAMMYAFVYLLMVIKKGCLICADDAALYTGSRLLGEIYAQKKKTGFGKLFSSRFVEKYRYGNRLDQEKQTEKMKSSLEAVCRHEEVSELTLFNPGVSESIKDSVTEAIKDLGLKISEMTAAEDINENDLCDAANAVILTGNLTEVSGLCRLTELLNDYDIRLLGTVYASEI